MPKKTLPLAFKKKFLLYFTQELIKNSASTKILEEIVKFQVEEKIHEKIVQDINPKLVEKEIEKKEKLRLPLNIPLQATRPVFIPQRLTSPRMLIIPEPRLPPTMQYLKPTPTSRKIELGKLNPLIQDPLVKVIECNGPDERLIVEGGMGRKPTDIILSKEDIEMIVEKFSESSKIPTGSGIYRVVVGRLILTAILSTVIGSKFIIKKLAYQPDLMPSQKRY
jgi:hypothetical protein